MNCGREPARIIESEGRSGLMPLLPFIDHLAVARLLVYEDSGLHSVAGRNLRTVWSRDYSLQGQWAHCDVAELACILVESWANLILLAETTTNSFYWRKEIWRLNFHHLEHMAKLNPWRKLSTIRYVSVCVCECIDGMCAAYMYVQILWAGPAHSHQSCWASRSRPGPPGSAWRPCRLHWRGSETETACMSHGMRNRKIKMLWELLHILLLGV